MDESKKILIVEDDADLVEAMKIVLENDLCALGDGSKAES